MKKRLLAILLALALAFALAACGNGATTTTTPAPGGSASPSSSPAPGGSPSPNPGTGGTTTPNPGTGGTTTPAPGATTPPPVVPGKTVEITVAFNALPNGLDPISEDTNTTISVCDHFYDHLVYQDYAFNWNPGVAKSWKQVDDVTWEFEINLDYVFHNGDKLKMDDVVFSIMRLKDIPKAADNSKPIADVFYQGNILTIKLVAPNNTSIPALLTACIIVNKAYIEAGGDEAIYLKPVGTGPYKMTEFTPGTSVTIETWDGYPFEKPQIDKINFICIPDNASRYIAVETGRVQYAGLVTAFEVNLAKKDGRFNLIEGSSNRTAMYMINVEKGKLGDVNVRRALAHALDRESICDLAGGRPILESVLFGGFPDLYYVSPNLPEFDMAKARELLEAAGVTAASPLNIEVMFFTPDPGVELYQSALKTLNVNLTLTQVEFSAYLARQAQNDYEMCWSAIRNNGGYALTDMDRMDSRFAGSRNLARYNNPVMDELIDKARVTTNQTELLALTKQINDIAAQDCPKIPVFLQGVYAVMDNKLFGVSIRGDLQQNFRYATYTG